MTGARRTLAPAPGRARRRRRRDRGTALSTTRAHVTPPRLPVGRARCCCARRGVLGARCGRRVAWPAVVTKVDLILLGVPPCRSACSHERGCTATSCPNADNVVLMRMNSAGDIEELCSVFSHAPRSTIEEAKSFRQGELLVAGPIAAHAAARGVPWSARCPEGGADLPTTWAAGGALATGVVTATLAVDERGTARAPPDQPAPQPAPLHWRRSPMTPT